jgi:ABC-2 type transport system permease protein
VWGIAVVKESLLIALSGALVPLAFFPSPLDRILALLPFAAVFHAPVGMLAESDAGWSTLAGRLGLQIAWLAVLWAVTRLAAARALRDVRVAGG